MRMLLVALLAAMTSSAIAQPKVVEGVLVDSSGMTLYVWDNDLTVPGTSQCNGACTLTWLPMLAEDGAKASGDYTLVARDDGKLQWAYKGRPLYRWVNDSKPGDRTGDGFRGGIWHVVRP